MSLVLMIVSVAAELLCCVQGHRERQPAARSAMPSQLGAELECNRPRTRCTLSCIGDVGLSASALGPASRPQAQLRRLNKPLCSYLLQAQTGIMLLTASAHLLDGSCRRL